LINNDNNSSKSQDDVKDDHSKESEMKFTSENTNDNDAWTYLIKKVPKYIN